MSEPWGLSGPQFLVLYGFALLLACGAVVVAYSRARRPSFRGDVRVELGTYERAYLNGGANRVADAAVAGLIAAHKVRITRQREMAFVGPKEPGDSFEQLVREHLDGRSKISDVRRAVRRSGACEPLERSLRDQKLLVPAPVHRRLVAVTALFPLLMAIGVARAVEGSVLGRPIGDLLCELLLGGIAWWFAAMTCRPPIATRFGEAVKSRDPLPESYWPATDQPRRYRPFAPADLARLEGPEPVEAAADIVAVEGLSSYPDRKIAQLLEPSRTGSGAGVVGGGGGGCGG